MKKTLMRGISDKTLDATLSNHEAYIRGLVAFANRTILERRFVLAWGVVVTLALIWLGVRG